MSGLRRRHRVLFAEAQMIVVSADDDVLRSSSPGTEYARRRCARSSDPALTSASRCARSYRGKRERARLQILVDPGLDLVEILAGVAETTSRQRPRLTWTKGCPALAGPSGASRTTRALRLARMIARVVDEDDAARRRAALRVDRLAEELRSAPCRCLPSNTLLPVVLLRLVAQDRRRSCPCTSMPA